MVHFPDHDEKLMRFDKNQKRSFLKDLDLSKVKFELKISDFGYSKKLKTRKDFTKTRCGTTLYMAPQVVEK